MVSIRYTPHTDHLIVAHVAHGCVLQQDEVFLHFFEQYGDVTFLMLLCGYKVHSLSMEHTCYH